MIEEIYYECQENDNYIKVITINGVLDEVRVGCHLCREAGESVIGAHDLENAFKMARIGILDGRR